MILRRFLPYAMLTMSLVIAFTAGAFAQGTPQASTTQQPQSPSAAGPGRHMHGPRDGGRGFMRVLADLNLTDAQKQQAQEIMQRYEESTRPQRDELRRLGGQSQQGTLSADDEAKAKQLRGDLSEAHKKMHDEIVAILTPDQRAKLEQKEQEWKANRRGPGSEKKGDQQ